jgi:hypothetical protein
MPWRGCFRGLGGEFSGDTAGVPTGDSAGDSAGDSLRDDTREAPPSLGENVLKCACTHHKERVVVDPRIGLHHGVGVALLVKPPFSDSSLPGFNPPPSKMSSVLNFFTISTTRENVRN